MNCTNDLILTHDDGVSALIWGRRVRAALEAGREVLAVTDTDNTYLAIGTGDDLPGYDSTEMGFSKFQSFKAIHIEERNLNDPKLLEAVDAVSPGGLIAWNLDIFRSPGKLVEGNRVIPDPLSEEVWEPLATRLRSGVHQHLFEYTDRHFEMDPVALNRLRAMALNSVAGWDLTYLGAHRLIEAIRPDWGTGLWKKYPLEGKSGYCSWDVITESGYRRQIFKYRLFRDDPKAYPSL